MSGGHPSSSVTDGISASEQQVIGKSKEILRGIILWLHDGCIELLVCRVHDRKGEWCSGAQV